VIFGGLVPPLGPVEAIVRAVLAPSVANDPCENMDELIEEIERGEAICWLITEGEDVRGCVVTQIVGQPDHLQLFIRHCAGDGIKDWLHYLRLIEMWGISQGCDSMELIGRAGWLRMLAPTGWRQQAIVMRKIL